MAGTLAVRTALVGGLLLVATSGVLVVPATADAATACDAPDTTWVGPATWDGDRSWTLASNWSDGVPGTSSTVCVPAGTNADPLVTAGTTATVAAVGASAAGVDVQGSLTVTESWDAGWMGVDGGELTLLGAATLAEGRVDEPGRLTVAGPAVLRAPADIHTWTEKGLGVFEVTPTGSLTLDDDDPAALYQIYGDLVNHGTVQTLGGMLDIVGGPPDLRPLSDASDGTFVAAPGTRLIMGPHVLGDGALLQGVVAFDVVVPAGATVTAAHSVFWPSSLADGVPGLTGGGEVRLVDGTSLGGGVAGQVTLRVPPGEHAVVAATLEEHARLVVEGSASTPHGDLAVLDDAVLEVTDGGVWDTSTDGPSQTPYRSEPLGQVEVDRGGELVGGGPHGSVVRAEVTNRGTLRTEGGTLAVLGALTTNGAGGVVDVGAGTALTTTGDFRSAGTVTLDATARLVPGGRFTQEGGGTLRVEVSRAAAGRVVAGGVRDLAGTLVLSPRRDAWPPLGTRRTVVSSDGRATRRDAFDLVRAPRRSGLTARVRYGTDRVWLRVVG